MKQKILERLGYSNRIERMFGRGMMIALTGQRRVGKSCVISQTNIDGIKHIHLRDFLKMTTLVWCQVDDKYHHIIKGLYATCSSWYIDPSTFNTQHSTFNNLLLFQQLFPEISCRYENKTVTLLMQ
jgi:hypothetical protein